VRYELSDSEWAAIKPFLPNKSRGVRRVNDRRVLNGIFWSSVQVHHLLIGPKRFAPIKGAPTTR